MPAVDITLGERCCGHALDHATAGTYPQPLSASKCPCWWPRLRCRAGDVSESGGLTGGYIPAAVVEQLRDRPRLDRRQDIGNPWNRSWNELRGTTERRGCQGPPAQAPVGHQRPWSTRLVPASGGGSAGSNGPAGDRGAASKAFRRGELVDVLADLCGDPVIGLWQHSTGFRNGPRH